MADRMTWPLWRHAIFGVMMALVLVSIASPLGAQLPILGIVLLSIFLVVRDDKKRHGMFVSGYQKGRTGWVLALQFAFFIAALVATEFWIEAPSSSPLFWTIAAAMLIGSTMLSLLWEKIYQADLRRGRV
ncbi:MAG: hypothetical protein GW855_13370 [Erythrobacter sp.]|nr:hypothetical protein [Erythrobacter sp.]NCQ63944.1 hypothetical protein [Alphaproteobacteria bacterium]